MDAIALLKTHHKKAKAALKKLHEGYDQKTLDTLASELAAHMIIEEKIFYPAVVEAKPDLVLESYEEHAIAQLALKRLVGTAKGDHRFGARAKALLDLLKHHIEEEEEDLFPKSRKALDAATLKALGAKMESKFDDLVAQTWKKTLPKPPAEVTGDDESKQVSEEEFFAEAV